jgi:hypothetical protein
MKKRELSDKQKVFLEVLFGDEAKGDFIKAKYLAGYAETTPTTQIVSSLKEEIIEATKDFIVRSAPKAAYSLADTLDRPTQLGLQYKLAAAAQILDRSGIVKTEKMEISGGSAFILPPKD